MRVTLVLFITALLSIVTNRVHADSIADCTDSASNLRKSPVGFRCKTSAGAIFERVEKQGFGEAWIGPDGVVWSDVIGDFDGVFHLDAHGKPAPTAAMKACADIKGQLPDVMTFKSAQWNRFWEVLPNTLDRPYWSSTYYEYSRHNYPFCDSHSACLIGFVSRARDPGVPWGTSWKTMFWSDVAATKHPVRCVDVSAALPRCLASSVDLRKALPGFKCLSSEGATFERVARDGLGEAWRTRDGVIWGDKIAGKFDNIGPYNFDDDLILKSPAIDACLKVSANLPTIEQVSVAESYGFYEVLPSFAKVDSFVGEIFWTRTTNRREPDVAWTYGIYYDDNGNYPTAAQNPISAADYPVDRYLERALSVRCVAQ